MPNGVNLSSVSFESEQNGATIYQGDTVLVSFSGIVNGTAEIIPTPDGNMVVELPESIGYDAQFDVLQSINGFETPYNEFISQETAQGVIFSFAPFSESVPFDSSQWSAGTYTVNTVLIANFEGGAEAAYDDGGFEIYNAVDLDYFEQSVTANVLGLSASFTLHDALFGGSGDFGDYGFDVVLSDDAEFTSDDILLASFTVADADSVNFAEHSFSISADMPADLAQGDYHVGLIYDPTDAYFEVEENQTQSITTFTVEALEPVQPTDLTGQILSATRVGDAVFEITYQVDDRGETPLEEPVYVDFIIDYTVDGQDVSIEPFSLTVYPEQIGQEIVSIVPIFLEADQVLPEDITLRMELDGNSYITESDEDNNSDTFTAIDRYDSLGFELGRPFVSMENPTDDVFGIAFTLTTPVSPDLSIDGDIEAELVLASESSELSLGRFSIGAANYIGSEGSNSYEFYGDLNVPSGLASGTYELTLNIDPSDEYAIKGGSQSQYMGSITVDSSGPDLELVSAGFDVPYFGEEGEILSLAGVTVNASDIGDFDEDVTVSYYVDTFQDNFGQGNLGSFFGPSSGNWIDQLQGEEGFDPIASTQLLGEFTISADVFGQQQTHLLELPDLGAGEYALRAEIDSTNVLAERDESNNSYSFSVLIEESLSALLEEFGSGDENGPGEISEPSVTNIANRHSDFDNDGADDILLFNGTTGSVGQFEFNGDGWSSIGSASAGWEAVDTGMLDGSDAYADVVLLNRASGEIGCFDMEDGTNAGWQRIAQAGTGWEYINAADTDGDGQDELVWFMNYDGIDDLVVQNEATGVVGQFRMSADGSSEWRKIGVLGEGWEVAGTASFWDTSFDEEEKDVFLFNAATNSFGCFDLYDDESYWAKLGKGGADWQLEGVSDLNGDGTDDILWRNDSGKFGEHMVSDGEMTWATDGFAHANWDVVL